jgi:hypothetical protein
MVADLKREAFSDEGFKRCVERSSRLIALEHFKQKAENNITWLQRTVVATILTTFLLKLI